MAHTDFVDLNWKRVRKSMPLEPEITVTDTINNTMVQPPKTELSFRRRISVGSELANAMKAVNDTTNKITMARTKS